MTTVVVAVGSRHGATRAIADEVARTLQAAGADVVVRPGGDRMPVGPVDLAVVGGALYSGRWHRDARRFLRLHRAELAGTRVAVFGSGPRRDAPEAWASSRGQLERAVGRLPWLRPVAVEVFGGADADGSRDLRDWDAVRAWAGGLLA